MILIYSEHTTNRLNYTLNVIFKHVLKVDYRIIPYEEFVTTEERIKINYSSKEIENCISINPHTILFETDIHNQKIKVDWINKLPYFFKTSKVATFSYDLFAAVFFMCSRYEEYENNILDKHNRFQAEESVAFQQNFLELPVVNLWSQQIKSKILEMDSEFHFPEQKYQFINSLDIDSAYAYKGKGFIRLFSSTLKALLKGDFSEVKRRYSYFTKSEEDPFDSYDFINALEKEHNTKNLYFFLLGDYGKYDINLSHTSKKLQNLIQKISKENTVGIHPSYLSNSDKNRILTEKNRLERIISKKTTISRQHFLKLNVPLTYENLIYCGIKEDYSMGYASQIGFRAGICTPFPFFNIIKNEERDLLITPFQIMDGTLKDYLKLTPKQAIVKIEQIVKNIRNIEGTFVSLWHNSSVTKLHGWKDWIYVYKTLLKIAKR